MEQLSIWLLLGIITLILEMLTGTFLLIFVSLGAFAAAILATFPSATMLNEILLFGVVSIFGAIFLRNPLQRKLMKSLNIKADIGKQIQTDQSILPHQQARITYQGTSWVATNLDSTEIKQNDHIVIVGIDGNVLLIRKVD